MGSEHDLHEYVGKLTQIFSRAYVSLKQTGSLWVHSKDTRFTNGCFMMIPESIANKMVSRDRWILRDKCIWYRSNTHDDDPTCWSEDWDYLYRFTKNANAYTDKHGMWTSIFEFPYIKPPPDDFIESGFPQTILDILITATCPPGGTVMDCFCGTATTGVSALKNGRKFIGIDMDPSKISRAGKRLKATSES